MKHAIRIVTDESQVPERFLRLREYEVKFGKTTACALSKAANDGDVASVKLMRTTTDIRGPIFICEDSAMDFMEARKTRIDVRNVSPRVVQPDPIFADLNASIQDLISVVEKIEMHLRPDEKNG